MTGEPWPGEGVRPTLRCLADDLKVVPLPTLDVRLEDIRHELIEKAQDTPQRVDAGGSERIASIDDFVWLKVKASGWRGAVLQPDRASNQSSGDESLWWLGAGGRRQADSPQTDFYSRFERDCVSARKRNPDHDKHDRTDSSGFLPAERDTKRLEAERALRFARNIPHLVRRLALMSLSNGHPAVATLNGWEIRVLIRAEGDHAGAEAYIVLAGSGITDAGTFAVILSAIPGVGPDDWMPEPSTFRGLRPGPGEIVFSAVLPAGSQAELLALQDQE